MIKVESALLLGSIYILMCIQGRLSVSNVIFILILPMVLLVCAMCVIYFVGVQTVSDTFSIKYAKDTTITRCKLVDKTLVFTTTIAHETVAINTYDLVSKSWRNAGCSVALENISITYGVYFCNIFLFPVFKQI